MSHIVGDFGHDSVGGHILEHLGETCVFGEAHVDIPATVGVAVVFEVPEFKGGVVEIVEVAGDGVEHFF